MGIPSLFVFGNLDVLTQERAAEWAPVGFVGKPYSEREVITALQKLEENARQPMLRG
jgi:FixJ family two-component response regulator